MPVTIRKIILRQLIAIPDMNSQKFEGFFLGFEKGLDSLPPLDSAW